jgi:hypothetical protein
VKYSVSYRSLYGDSEVLNRDDSHSLSVDNAVVAVTLLSGSCCVIYMLPVKVVASWNTSMISVK